MIFTPDNVQKILAGEKTQTRRIVKSGEELIHPGFGDTVLAVSQDYLFGRNKWTVGHDYAVCPGRGKHQVARIRILAIRRERLQNITFDEAYAELGLSRYAFADWYHDIVGYFAQIWDSINAAPGTRWEDNPEVWVLEFELA